MSKLDINTLLNRSLAKKAGVVTEGSTSAANAPASGLNINLESVATTETSDCPGCPKQEVKTTVNSDLNINLEAVSYQEKVMEFLGEETINNIKGAIGAGMATFAVLEARQAAR